jgi:HPt (histidine-containing phosphotransfer) domain-containing protein
MSEALGRLWTKFRPEIENRIVILEAAATALAAASLAVQERDAAHQAAHKLAGVLGTFGLHRGTDLARQIELELAEEVPASAAADLSAWIAELRLLVQDRK